MLKLSNEQLAKLTLHTSGICNVLLEVCATEKERQQANSDEPLEILFSDTPETKKPASDTRPKFVPMDYVELDRLRRELAMGILCGRWSSGKRTIEISRAGDHFILTFLKRNGTPSDERYILMWIDGDILYYGYEDRLTTVAHNENNDVLMLSPGMDYTRMPKEAM